MYEEQRLLCSSLFRLRHPRDLEVNHNREGEPCTYCLEYITCTFSFSFFAQLNVLLRPPRVSSTHIWVPAELPSWSVVWVFKVTRAGSFQGVAFRFAEPRRGMATQFLICFRTLLLYNPHRPSKLNANNTRYNTSRGVSHGTTAEATLHALRSVTATNSSALSLYYVIFCLRLGVPSYSSMIV